MTSEQRLSRVEIIVVQTDKQLAKLVARATITDEQINKLMAQSKATDQRLDRLAAAVTAFVKSSTGFQIEITRLVRSHAQQIERLEQMVTRFDEWLRGQGPTDGRGKRNPRG
ncbi:MAG TPA: hypothetical protein VKM93_13230 [Terriglobia bacterium]|nr:hypothetical protein [Terriglobia bacterium]